MTLVLQMIQKIPQLNEMSSINKQKRQVIYTLKIGSAESEIIAQLQQVKQEKTKIYRLHVH